MYQIRLVRGEEILSPAEPAGIINAVRDSCLSPEDRSMVFGYADIQGTRYAFIEASGLRIEEDASSLVRALGAAARREMRRYRGRNLPEAFTLRVSMAKDRHNVTTP